jgi:hypothetical protein
MDIPELQYRAYIVRVWQSQPASGPRPEAARVQEWIAQVETLADGVKRYFSTPEALVAYLETEAQLDVYDGGER